MSMWRVQTTFVGPTVTGDGLNTLYFDSTGGSAVGATLAVFTFWNGLAGAIHSAITFTVLPEVAEIDEVSGDTLAVVVGTSQTSAAGAAGTPAAKSTQGLIQWRTGVFRDGREVRGRTFVPGVTTGALSGGRPTQGYRDVLQAAADGLLATTAAQPVVWRRPRPEEVPPNPDKPARDGLFEQIQLATAWDEFAVLRSRRD